MDGFDLGSVVAHVKAETGQFSTAMNGVQGMLANVASGGVAAGAAIAGIAAIAAAAFSIKEATEFNKQMTLIQTQAGASKEEMKHMSEAVLDMGGTVAQGPIELSKGLFHIESAGYRGAAALAILKVAADGAAVGNANLEDVTNALVAAEATHIKGLGDTAHAMGVLNGIVGSGNMRMTDLAAALSTGILPAARSVGISIQDVGAAIDTMTINGVPAIDAATRLRMTFSLMEAPTAKASKAFASIGMTSRELADDMRTKGLIPALRDLQDHLNKSGMDATEQAQVISHAFGGGRTSSAMLTLLGNLDTMQKSFDNIGHTTKNFGADVAAAAETPAEKWAKLGSAFQSLAIRVGQDLTPALSGLVTYLTDFVMWLEKAGKAYEEHKRLINDLINMMLLTLAPMLFIQLHYKRIQEIARDTWQDTRDFAERMWQDLTGFAERIYNDVTGFFLRIWHDINGFYQRILQDGKNWADNVVDLFQKGWKHILDDIIQFDVRSVKAWFEMLDHWWQGFDKWLKALPDKLWQGFDKDIWQPTAKWLETVPDKLYKELDHWWQSMDKWIKSLPDKISTELELWWKAIEKWVKSIPKRLEDQLEAWWKELKKWFDDLPGKLKDSLENSGKQMGTKHADSFASVWKDGKKIAQIAGIILAAILLIPLIIAAQIAVAMINLGIKVIGWFMQGISWALNGLIHLASTIGSTVLNAVGHAGNWLYNTGKDIINGLIRGVRDAIGGVGGAIGKIGKDIGGAVTGALHAVHIPGFASGVQNFKGGLALVGENGPELVQLPRGSNVVPNSQLQGIAQNITTNINGNINIGSKSDADYFLKKLTNNQELAMKGLTPVR